MGFDHHAGHLWPRSMMTEQFPMLFSLLARLSHDSNRFRKIVIEGDGRRDVLFTPSERVAMRRGEPYGNTHGTAEFSNAPVLRSGAEEFVPGTEGARVANAMIEARICLSTKH